MLTLLYFRIQFEGIFILQRIQGFLYNIIHFCYPSKLCLPKPATHHTEIDSLFLISVFFFTLRLLAPVATLFGCLSNILNFCPVCSVFSKYQRFPNVSDVGPALAKRWRNALAFCVVKQLSRISVQPPLIKLRPNHLCVGFLMCTLFIKLLLMCPRIILGCLWYRPTLTSQQTQNICITFIQCWTNVEDVGPTYTDI